MAVTHVRGISVADLMVVGARKQIRWDHRDYRLMRAHLARHRLSKATCRTHFFGEIVEALDLNYGVEFNATVHPRLQNALVYQLGRISQNGHVKLGKDGARGHYAHWHERTRDWLKPDWVGDIEPVSTDDTAPAVLVVQVKEDMGKGGNQAGHGSENRNIKMGGVLDTGVGKVDNNRVPAQDNEDELLASMMQSVSLTPKSTSTDAPKMRHNESIPSPRPVQPPSTPRHHQQGLPPLRDYVPGSGLEGPSSSRASHPQAQQSAPQLLPPRKANRNLSEQLNARRHSQGRQDTSRVYPPTPPETPLTARRERSQGQQLSSTRLDFIATLDAQARLHDNLLRRFRGIKLLQLHLKTDRSGRMDQERRAEVIDEIELTRSRLETLVRDVVSTEGELDALMPRQSRGFPARVPSPTMGDVDPLLENLLLLGGVQFEL